MTENNTSKLTVFHCVNAFKETASMFEGCEAKVIKMACSSMTKDVQLLRAFESGADGVLVFVCPDQACRYAEGAVRAKKRVDYVKKILDDIEMDGRRLKLYNTTAADGTAAREAIKETLKELEAPAQCQ